MTAKIVEFYIPEILILITSRVWLERHRKDVRVYNRIQCCQKKTSIFICVMRKQNNRPVMRAHTTSDRLQIGSTQIRKEGQQSFEWKEQNKTEIKYYVTERSHTYPPLEKYMCIQKLYKGICYQYKYVRRCNCELFVCQKRLLSGRIQWRVLLLDQ